MVKEQEFFLELLTKEYLPSPSLFLLAKENKPKTTKNRNHSVAVLKWS